LETPEDFAYYVERDPTEQKSMARQSISTGDDGIWISDGLGEFGVQVRDVLLGIRPCLDQDRIAVLAPDAASSHRSGFWHKLSNFLFD